MNTRLMRFAIACASAMAILLFSAGVALAIAPSVICDVSSPGNTAPSAQADTYPYWWYNAPVTYTFHYIEWGDPIMEGNYDIVSVHYNRDDGPDIDVVPTSTLTLSADGTYSISCQGTWGGYAFPIWLGIDKTPPLSTLSATMNGSAPAALPETPGRTSWSRTDVRVSLDATDGANGSGLATTSCSVDSGAASTYADAFTISSEGEHRVDYSAMDACNNAETTKTAKIGIDKSAPQLLLDAAGSHFGVATIGAAASDALSGLGCVEMSLDSTADWKTCAKLSTTVLGSHTVYARATDVAGNSTVAGATFIVSPPLVTTTRLSGPSSVRAKRALRLAGKVSPAAADGWVTITKTRKVGKKWKSAGSAKVQVAHGSFSYSFKPKYKGSWRFVAKYAGSASESTVYGSSKSSTRGVKVK